MKFVQDDGGRYAASFRDRRFVANNVRDCVTRAVAIATGKPYTEVYDRVNALSLGERTGKRKRGRSTARNGVYKGTIKKLMAELGFTWTPTMQIGSGCTVHMREHELPLGRIVVSLSRHLCAVIDGVCYDTEDPTRNGTRCVYGFWTLGETK